MHKINYLFKRILVAFVLVAPVLSAQPVFAGEKERPAETLPVIDKMNVVEATETSPEGEAGVVKDAYRDGDEAVNSEVAQDISRITSTSNPEVVKDAYRDGGVVADSEITEDMVRITTTTVPESGIGMGELSYMAGGALLLSAGGAYLIKVRKPKSK